MSLHGPVFVFIAGTSPVRPSASTTAASSSSSSASGVHGHAAAAGANKLFSGGAAGGGGGVASGHTSQEHMFGDEVEVASLLVLDQHTFEGKRQYVDHFKSLS